MKGTIQPRGNKVWRLRVDIGRDPVTGKRKVASKTVRGTKREAQAELAKLVVAHTGQRPGTDATFAALMAAWLEQIETHRSPLTFQRYEQAARVHLLPALGHMPVGKITGYDLDRVYLAMARSGAGPAGIRKVHQVALGALGQAVRWKWIGENPARDASPPPLKRSEIKPPTPELVRQVFAVVADRDPAFALYVHLAAVTGRRRGEVCALRWSDLDPATGTLRVARNVITVRGARTLEKETKTDRVSKVKLPPTTLANLAAHRTRMGERMLTVGLKVSDDDFLFPAERDETNRRTLRADRPTRPDVMTARWARLRGSVPGAERVRLHDLRHHAATQLIAGGVDLRKVMDRLGWVTLASVQRYVHLVEEADDEAAMVLERVLHPA